MQLWTTRIEFDDRCGQLAELTAAIAALGASIVDLDVHRLGGDQVADDLVIDAKVPIDAPLLALALEQAGARVASLRPADPHELADRATRALDLAAGARSRPDLTTEALAAHAAQLVQAELAWVGPVPGFEPPPLAADALASGTPSRGPLPVKGLPPRTDGGPPWGLAVPVDRPGAPRAVLVLLRPNPAFSFTETARVQAFLRLCAAGDPADRQAPTGTVRLDDGGAITVRDLNTDDAPALVRLHHRCSEQTRYRRYFTPKPRLGSPVLHQLVDVDNRDRVGVAATTGSEIVGVAHLHRSRDDPGTGELAVLVEDGHQHRGIGTVLARALLERAEHAGLEHLVALTLPDNDAIARLLRRIAAPLHADLVDGLRRFTIPVSPHQLVR